MILLKSHLCITVATGNCLSRLGTSGSREGADRCKREAIDAFERAIKCDDR